MDIREMFSKAMEIPASRLAGIETLSEMERWDSLAILNFMALVDKNYGITLAPDELIRCESIADVDRLINQVTGSRL